MPDQNDVLRLYDAQKNLVAVQISAALWEKLEPLAAKLLARPLPPQPAPMAEFETFMRAWDFRYPYDPAVRCPGCQASAKDWREDSPFVFRNASIGGLLVFYCKSCGGTIRHKYFKDRRSVEYSPGGRP